MAVVSCAGVVQLLNSGRLPRDFWDWEFSAGFSWGPDAEEEEAQLADADSGNRFDVLNLLSHALSYCGTCCRSLTTKAAKPIARQCIPLSLRPFQSS